MASAFPSLSCFTQCNALQGLYRSLYAGSAHAGAHVRSSCHLLLLQQLKCFSLQCFRLSKRKQIKN